MHAEEQYPHLLREKGPHAVDAPARLIGMHYQRVGQQQAQQLEFLFPLPRQLVQQGVGLRLPQRQVLEEVHQQAYFVEGKADHVHLVGNGQHDLRPELAAAEDARNLAVLVLRAAINVIGHQDRLAVFQPPCHPRVRQPAICLPHPSREDFLGSHGLSDLLSRANPSARPLLSPPPLPSSRLLPPFFCLHRERLRNLRRRAALQLTLQLFVPALKGHNQIDQPIGCDPPRMNIFPELLNIHATLIADFPKSGSASFQGMDGYPRRFLAARNVHRWRKPLNDSQKERSGDRTVSLGSRG